jgi:hypothetical protein
MKPTLILITLAVSLLISPRESNAQQKAPQKGFVIIAPARFHKALEAFVANKRGQLPTELVALEDVLKGARGVDDPERLKRYLFDAWKARKIGYALLVGDADVMPVRYMCLDRVTKEAFDYAFYPSDLYYADLAHRDGSFDDWNSRRDGFHAGYFGEVRGEKNKHDPINFDAIDYRPEIAVGHWPVSDVAHVAIVAEKSLAYERQTHVSDGRLKRRAAFFNVGGWVDGRGLMDRLAKTLPKGWTVDKRYYESQPRTPPPDEHQLVTLLNQGVGLALHIGHGSDDTWDGCLSVNSLKRVKNANHLPVMISAGCSTARFATLPPYEGYVDVQGKTHRGSNNGEVFNSPPPPPAPYQSGPFNPTGLGEQLLRRGQDGAAAYIGCNTGGQPCGLTLLEGFVQGLASSDEPRLGDCWSHAIDHYYQAEHLATLKPNDDWYPPSIFFQGMKYMVFGDPTLRLPLPERPSK